MKREFCYFKNEFKQDSIPVGCVLNARFGSHNYMSVPVVIKF